MKALLLCLLISLFAVPAIAANTVTLNADLVSGNGSVTPTLTWSTSPVADNCTASGGWTGTKAASGSEKIPAITVSKTFVLSCSWNSGTATINWTVPTTNTDGSPLTDLAGYKIYRSILGSPESLIKTIASPSTVTYVDGPLTPATYGYTMTSINTGNIESDHTNQATKTIVAANDSQQIAITVNPKPNPPGGFSVN